MNYLDSEQKQKLEKILSLQNNIEASKEKQEERISSYDNYLNNNISNKAEEELKIKKIMMLKHQRDKKKKLEKKMNDWVHKQEKISEKQKKENEKNKKKENNKNNNDNEEENDKNKESEEEEDENNDYNEKFDISKYNVISLDNMKNDEEDKNNNNDEIKKENNNNNNDNNNNINNEFICIICQRKFTSAEKLALHEKLSELHKKNLDKLKLNNNNNN